MIDSQSVGTRGSDTAHKMPGAPLFVSSLTANVYKNQRPCPATVAVVDGQLVVGLLTPAAMTNVRAAHNT